MPKMFFDWNSLEKRAESVAASIRKVREKTKDSDHIRLYGVPRGGTYAAIMVANVLRGDFNDEVELVIEPEQANFIVDDLIDSGHTYERFHKIAPFFALINKKQEKLQGTWLEFPWELGEAGPEDAVLRILQFIGEDPTRDGLVETPARVVKSYAELFSGYTIDPASVMATFEQPYDEMVVLKDVEFCSTCEHHMLPFVGVAHIAYVPQNRVIGVSKLARILEIYSRRLQIQERICQQVTDALDKYLEPLGSACVLEAKHLCMTCRGVRKQSSTMTTSSLTGVFRKQKVRTEFLSMLR